MLERGEKMSKKTCHECENIMYQPMCDNTLCPIENENFAEQCGGFTQIHKCPKTVFEHITTSAAVLADKLVFYEEDICMNGKVITYWTSNVIQRSYSTREEAVAATIDALNELRENEVKDVK